MKKTLLLTSLALLPISGNASVLTMSLDAPARRALEAIQCAGLTPKLLLIADMTKSKDSPRLRVLDLDTGKTILTDYVAHGVGSGSDVPRRFSNVEGSLATSLGLYRISERYQGISGWSRRLDGLTQGWNTNARQRAVVMHPATYVRPGRVGRSEGCPAVRNEVLVSLEKQGLSDAVLWIDGGKAVETCSTGNRLPLIWNRRVKENRCLVNNLKWPSSSSFDQQKWFANN